MASCIRPSGRMRIETTQSMPLVVYRSVASGLLAG